MPRAWMVGRYLEAYAARYVNGVADVKLGWRVVRAVRERDGGWCVEARSGEEKLMTRFDYLVVASGFFGRPKVDETWTQGSGVPVVHSTQYRDLKGLFGDKPRRGSKILVVGGQMSGVEISGTIATHISSATHSAEEPPVPDPDKLSVHNLIQRPVWVLPLHTSPTVTFTHVWASSELSANGPTASPQTTFIPSI